MIAPFACHVIVKNYHSNHVISQEEVSALVFVSHPPSLLARAIAVEHLLTERAARFLVLSHMAAVVALAQHLPALLLLLPLPPMRDGVGVVVAIVTIIRVTIVILFSGCHFADIQLERLAQLEVLAKLDRKFLEIPVRHLSSSCFEE
jgi:hypothetical protein